MTAVARIASPVFSVLVREPLRTRLVAISISAEPANMQ